MQDPRQIREDATMARTFHYPAVSVARGFVRSFTGGGVTLALWLAAGASLGSAIVAVPVALVFVAYGVAAVKRGLSVVMIDDTGISVSGMKGGQLKWRQMSKLRLAFYATRRRPDFAADGWMVLTVRQGKKRISVESEISGFAEIAKICRAHAQAAGVALSAATSSNFIALEAGVPAPGRVRGLRSILAPR